MRPRTPAAARPALVCAACGQSFLARIRKDVLLCRVCAARVSLALHFAPRRYQRAAKADDDA